ncbi:MAG: D-alanine--D-alanine ligase [bacterium]|nr:D-alanine--D-alanine ligase [bacterium]
MIDALKHKKITVLYGGFSLEREVSLRSGEAVYQALKRLGYNADKLDPSVDAPDALNCDLAFLALHGEGGEDGIIQAELESRNIPYTCAGVAASKIAINKLETKRIMRKIDIPTAPFTPSVLSYHSYAYPQVVKPIMGGSSIGVHICQNQDELNFIIEELGAEAKHYFTENYIPGVELTVGVIDTKQGPTVFPTLELRPKTRFYDYENKYTKGATEFICPAEIDPFHDQKAAEYAVQLFNAIGCKGVARVDMRVDPEFGPYVLEINTIPGFTETSDVPAQAAAAGINFDQLVEMVLESTL